MKKRTILITGATGFAGSFAVSFYLKCGYTVVAMLHDNLFLSSLERENKIRAQRLSIEDKNKNHKNLYFVTGSLNSADDIAIHLINFSVDAILHLAGESSVSRAESNPEYALSTNVQGTYNVASAADSVAIKTGIKIRFIFVSSIRVLKLDVLKNKACVYDRSKVLAENTLCDIKNIPIDIVYCAHLFGPGDSDTLIPFWIRKALNKEVMAIQANQDLKIELLSLKGFCEQTRHLIDSDNSEVSQSRILMKHEYIYSLKEISDIICACADRIAHENLNEIFEYNDKEPKHLISHRQLVTHERERKF